MRKKNHTEIYRKVGLGGGGEKFSETLNDSTSSHSLLHDFPGAILLIFLEQEEEPELKLNN